MGALMLVTGLLYLQIARSHWTPGSTEPHDLVHWVMLVIIGSIVVQIVLAIAARKDAGKPADERERIVLLRAKAWAGYVLAFGAIGGALGYLATGNGDGLFHIVFGSLIVSQVAEYAFQVLFFRRGY
jgi:hypothetical protein